MATAKSSANPGSGVRLVVVESPSKAKTISGFLGEGYIVESSVGHIRDLPRGAADVPAKYKGEPWARLGVNTENGFEPLYVISPEKRAQVAKLKSLLAGADELYLATDEDREGEAIAWHLLETLKPKVPVKRMVFHEITPAAIRAAAENPRALDDNLVDAQETRRILDRLYGYEVSPVLWKKVMPKLSAGRVQSVATRIIVQRERERMAFRAGPTGAWTRPWRQRHRRRRTRSSRRCRRLPAAGSLPGVTSTPPPAGSRPVRTCCCSTRTAPAPWPGNCRAAPHRQLGRGEALHPPALPAVHDVDAAAGGRPQARLQLRAHHADGAAAVRERLHHLHEDRLDDAERHRPGGGPRAGPRAVRAGSTCPTRPGSTPAR